VITEAVVDELHDHAGLVVAVIVMMWVGGVVAVHALGEASSRS